MENQEFTFKGKTINGFLMLILNIVFCPHQRSNLACGVNMEKCCRWNTTLLPPSYFSLHLFNFKGLIHSNPMRPV